MDAPLIRQLQDKSYDKRKTASFVVEGLVKDCLTRSDHDRLIVILEQLEQLATSANPIWRYGGVMGLAASSIALSTSIPPYLYLIVPPVINSFHEADIKLRYFACESMYNVAKVAKGEILPYFNELFDALSRLAADPDTAVKKGADLLDRLVKDIVTEQAATYVSILPHTDERAVDGDGGSYHSDSEPEPSLAFDLGRFIPLLRERIYVYDPFTRIFLVSWLQILDSIPELDLVSYLPEFLDGLIKYLGDSGSDVLVAVQNLLADFLREICEYAAVERARQREAQKRQEDRDRRAEERPVEPSGPSTDGGSSDALTPLAAELASYDHHSSSLGTDEPSHERGDDESDGSGAGAWVPGQGVHIDHAAIVQILISWLSIPDLVEPIQVVCLRWLSALLQIVPETITPFTPQLIPVILACLPHHSPSIHQSAEEANTHLFRAVSELQTPEPSVVAPVAMADSTSTGKSPNRTTKDRPVASPLNGGIASSRARPEPQREATTSPDPSYSGAEVLVSDVEKLVPEPEEILADPLDYATTVTALTLQFLNKNEETRLAALEWLLMLHAKVPDKVLSLDDGTFPALLKTLSDPSDQVIRLDLQLLSQISSRSPDDAYFLHFMNNLVSLFTTDRGLLEQRGTLIIRQLCTHLNPDRIYRTLAEILEKDEDLEFASSMVQNLNLIMITSPELADFRKRLKDSKDGQALFVILYRSFSHNAVATFTLCLLAQAYEPACSLLPIFAELETTLPLLVQIDKLVQLIESPVFTPLRLHLLEPERYPYLYKALYGILMLLPQSTAFATLRNRLGAVSTLGFLHTVPKGSFTGTVASRPPTRKSEEIQWSALLAHFRSVQMKHERLRRQGILGLAGHSEIPGYQNDFNSPAQGISGGSGPATGSRVFGNLAGLKKKAQAVSGFGNKSGGSNERGSGRSRFALSAAGRRSPASQGGSKAGASGESKTINPRR